MIGEPLHDRIVVRLTEEPQVSSGGLALIRSVEKPSRGVVLAVGPGKALADGSLCPIDLAVGDEILFGQGAGSQVKIDGEDLLVMREQDVLAVVGPWT